MNRTTPWPSTRTSALAVVHDSLPLIFDEKSPPPAVPPSSPLLNDRFDFLSAIEFPAILTEVLPFASALFCARLM